LIRIALVDDHPVVRAGLRALIQGQEDLSVIAEAETLEQAVAVVTDKHPDIVLMDLNLGDNQAGGADVTVALRALPNPPEVMVLTTYDTEADIMRVLEAGARGYMLKDAPPTELFAAIRSTARGETVLAPSVAATLIRRTTAGAATITEREVEVLELLSRGLGNKEIARELFVSEATVKSHLSHIYTKLAVDTRAGAVAAAIERRIIRP
jgi:DNA-binding NarL/FixJ family response regulator